MAEQTVTIPGKIHTALEERDVWDMLNPLTWKHTKTTSKATGSVQKLYELGDYLYMLADDMETYLGEGEKLLYASEMGGYGPKRLRAVAARFPTKADAREEARAEEAERAARAALDVEPDDAEVQEAADAADDIAGTREALLSSDGEGVSGAASSTMSDLFKAKLAHPTDPENPQFDDRGLPLFSLTALGRAVARELQKRYDVAEIADSGAEEEVADDGASVVGELADKYNLRHEDWGPLVRHTSDTVDGLPRELQTEMQVDLLAEWGLDVPSCRITALGKNVLHEIRVRRGLERRKAVPVMEPLPEDTDGGTDPVPEDVPRADIITVADRVQAAEDAHANMMCADDALHPAIPGPPVEFLAELGLISPRTADGGAHPLTLLGRAVSRELTTRISQRQDRHADADPHSVALSLSPADRRTVVLTYPDGVAPEDRDELVEAGVVGPRETRRVEWGTGQRDITGRWLTPLGKAVRRVLFADDTGTTAQDGTPFADYADPGSITVAAIETAWRAVQQRHADVPPVVVITGSRAPRLVRRGGETQVEVVWGHFQAAQWDTGDGMRHELLISGECLSKGPEHVLRTILHEATHALCHERGTKDTSRNGQYHNKRFVSAASELGLEWPDRVPDTSTGFSAVDFADGTLDTYGDTLAMLERGRAAWRTLVLPDTGDAEDGTPARKKSPRTTPKGVCGCPGKIIRSSRKVLTSGTVLCADCREPFRLEDEG